MTRANKVTGTIVITAAVTLAVVFIVRNAEHPAKYEHAFAGTLDSYFNNHQVCLWPNSIQMPTSVDTDQTAQIGQFNALVDAGLLDRTPAAAEHRARHARRRAKSPATVEYKLSDMGRVQWTPDPAQPNHGNFCYGHIKVNSVNSFARLGNRDFQVSYRGSLTLPPPWAAVPEVKKAFPQLNKEDRGENGHATLLRRGNAWQVQTVTAPGLHRG